MGILLSTHLVEGGNNGKAEVYNGNDGLYIEYYDNNGICYYTETCEDLNISQAEDKADAWASGVVLG